MRHIFLVTLGEINFLAFIAATLRIIFCNLQMSVNLSFIPSPPRALNYM